MIWAIGNTFLSRITTMLQNLIKNVSINYCKTEINEYCKDSEQYLEDLFNWKNNTIKEEIYIITADVKNVYSSLKRTLIKNSLEDCLKICTNYNSNQIKQIIDTIMFCLENNYISFKNTLYKNNQGIPTGENFSVSLANIALHFLTKKVNFLNFCYIYKRYIDDIIFLCPVNKSDIIQKELTKKFQDHNLSLQFKKVSNTEEGKELEFLDILHKIKSSEKNGFKTVNHIKPTAKSAKFLNGDPYHPAHVFRGIILSEANRLKKLNEKDKDYEEALINLKIKCIRSNFSRKLIKNTFNELENFFTKDTKTKNKKQEEHSEKVTWATSFKQFINFNKDEQSKNTELLRLTYKRPKTLRNILTNKNNFIKKEKNKTAECGKCALCGNFGNYNKSMVNNKKTIQNIKIKQNLNCKNHGIYAASCNICNDLYIGQTMNNFTKRWNAHRNIWKNNKTKSNHEIKDQFALIIHYKKFHKDNIPQEIENAYTVQFLESPIRTNLDYTEQWWIKKTKAKINLNSVIKE